MFNPFRLIDRGVVAVGHVFGHIFSANTLAKAEELGADVQAALPTALQAVKVADALVPNKLGPEFQALAEKYQEHVTPEVLADPLKLASLIQNSAVKEANTLDPSLSVNALHEAVSIATRMVNAEKSATPEVPVAE